MKSILLKSMALLVLVASASVTSAQTNDIQGQLSKTNFKFVKAAVHGGKMEVALGQIAVQNAQDPAVREFASKMVQDHQAANQQLAQLISQKGAAVSDSPGWMDEKMTSHLQGLKGSEFDRAYMKRMVNDHEKTIKEFQKEADDGEDADIKNFASKTLPTLQEHLRMAQDTQAKLGSSASK
jgi:putative membrane protein